MCVGGTYPGASGPEAPESPDGMSQEERENGSGKRLGG